VLPPLPELDRLAPVPLAQQIAGFYADAIATGRVPPGERLPTIRAVADGCAVTRSTVQDAYRRLADRGLVESTVGRGTVVLATGAAEGAPSGALSGAPSPRGALSRYAEAAMRRTQEVVAAPPLPPGTALVANFAELMPDDAAFPVDDWRLAMDAVLRTGGGELLGYGHAANGLPSLRALLAERSREFDPGVTADDVLVTAGAQQALDLVLRTFCSPGDTVLVSVPSYHQMHGLLRAHGLSVVQVPFGEAGLDLDRLARALERPVRLAYLMPTFHNPTGRTLTLAQRQALVDVVSRTDVLVVEDEYQTSLRCRGEALPTLRSLDPRNRTLTVSTVSKELFPALRIGWVVGGQELLRPMAVVKRFMDLESSPLLQAALVEFVRRGSFDRHLDALRAELRLRLDALRSAAAEHLPPGCTISDPDGGFVAWLELPQPGHGDRLAQQALLRGVRVVPGRMFDLHQSPSRGVRLSLTRATVEHIHAGLAVLGDCARQIVDAPVAAQPFL
jgi:DNA-binding transcriptional MocR family regulator